MGKTVLKFSLITLLVLALFVILTIGCAQKPAAPATSSAPATQPAAPAQTSAPAASQQPAAPAPSTSAAAPAVKAPANQIVWKLDIMWPKDDPETQIVQQAADDILELSEGRLRIDIYPTYSLRLNPATPFTNMKNGLTEIASIMVQNAEGEEPSFSVTEAPGIWSDKASVAKAVDALIPFKKQVYADVWGCQYITTKLLMVQRNGVFSNTRDLKSIDDLKGFKVRAPSSRQLEIFKALGAAPVQMPLGDVYLSLKTGVLDGASSGSRSLIYSKWSEVIKNGSENMIAEGGAQDIVVSKKAWDALPDDLKTVVNTVFESVHQRSEAMAINEGYSAHWKRQAEALGVKYYQWSDADLAKFKAACIASNNAIIAKANDRTLQAWNLVKQYASQ